MPLARAKRADCILQSMPNDDWTARLAGAYSHNQQYMKYAQGVGSDT